MLYPKDIVTFIKNDKELSKRFYFIEDNLDYSYQNKNDIFVFELWMREEGIKISEEIKRYLFYLSLMKDIFNKIYFYFNKTIINNNTNKDSLPAQSSPEEMFFIAQYLYCLDSYDVPGYLLECGCFKGFSTCCLSWACNFLNRKLIVADSFEGLPEVDNHWYYKSGEFKGGLELVKNNVSSFGRIENVEFIKGWFDKSLTNFKNNIFVLWTDVDLYQSTLDVLNNIFNKISKGGVIFSHEFSKQFISNNKLIAENSQDVMLAYYEYFQKNNIKYTTEYLTENTGIIIPNHEYKKGESIDSDIIDLFYQINNTSVIQPIVLNNIKAGKFKNEFFIDKIEKGYGYNKIYGWAIDIENKSRPKAVFIKIGKNIYPTFCEEKRIDLVEVFRNKNYENCGFIAYIPIENFQAGNYDLKIIILSSDGKCYYECDTNKSIDINEN